MQRIFPVVNTAGTLANSALLLRDDRNGGVFICVYPCPSVVFLNGFMDVKNLNDVPAVITKDGWLKRPALTPDGVEPAENAIEVKAGTPFTPELFEKLWEVHNEWTYAFFAEQDRRGDPGRFDRSKAPVIMELLKRQLLSPRYIQHSARVLFLLAEAGEREREELLDAIFDDNIANEKARAARDYVYDIR